MRSARCTRTSPSLGGSTPASNSNPNPNPDPDPNPNPNPDPNLTLRRLDPGFSRELLLRLCSKCAGSELCKGRRRAALLDACDAAATGAWAGAVTRPAEAESPLLFFARVTAALRMGRRFSVQRVLELRQADLAIT